MTPILIPEQLIHCFKVIAPDGCTREVMQSRGKLYHFVGSFTVEQGEQARERSSELSGCGAHVVITRSRDGYRVWQETTATR